MTTSILLDISKANLSKRGEKETTGVQGAKKPVALELIGQGALGIRGARGGAVTKDFDW